MDIRTLQQAKDAAAAAWAAAGKPRGDHPLFTAAMAANRALVAATNAARDVVADERKAQLDALADDAIATQRARNQRQREERELASALALWRQAQEYPRCGDEWAQPWSTPRGQQPACPRELRAERTLAAREARGDWSRHD